MPRSVATFWIRSIRDRRPISDSSAAFWRSIVVADSTARPMPAFIFSSDTCMNTIPPRPRPSSQIHAGPPTSRPMKR